MAITSIINLITNLLKKDGKNMPQKMNASGLQLLKNAEGLRLKAYRDSVNVLTIGYGHTGADVSEGQVITELQAEELLKKDIARFEAGVIQSVLVPVNDNQFSAMVSFSYNLGLGNFRSSTLLKKVNAKDFLGAAEEFLKWNRAGGQVLPGLTKRRAAERQLFLS